MTTERRQTPRGIPYEPVYVGLADQARGIVIDASEGGLHFRADDPIQHNEGTLPLRFAFSSLLEVETVGEIVWMDESTRTAGLRFNNLSESQRSNIRRWLEQNARLLPPRSDAEGAPTASTEAGAIKEAEGEPMVAAEYDRTGATIAAAAPRDSSRAGTFSPTSEFAVPWRPPAGARYAQADVPRHGVRTAVNVMLAFVIVAIIGFGLFFYWRAGGSTKSLGQSLLKWSGIGSQSDAKSSSAVSEISPLLRPPSKSHRIRPVIAGVGSDVALPLSPSPGAADLAIALQYLRGEGGQVETSVAVKWLWAAVEKGNTNAAMLLADLYAWGRGVPQNCEQARVLLIRASKRGSAEAAQQLQDMDADGCGSAVAPSK